MIDGFSVLLFEYCAGVLAVTLVSLRICRSIANRTVRALARLAIVVLVATPVPMADQYGTSSFAPACIAALRYLNLGGGSAAHGLFAFAVPIACLVAFAAFAPLVIAWVRLGEPYDRR